MSYAKVKAAAAPFGMQILGGFHDTGKTTLLLGPADDFWPIFSTSPEAKDNQPDPIDRWSTRVIKTLAQNLGAEPSLPFGGPPYAPFLNWALSSGRCWSSPAGMLVHDTMGLMISFRGALIFGHQLNLPKPPRQSPCDNCASQPCKTACPVNALGPDGYVTSACHDHLDSPDGQSCLEHGCVARRACPISPKRPDTQSAHHMRYFHR